MGFSPVDSMAFCGMLARLSPLEGFCDNVAACSYENGRGCQ